MLVDIPVKAKMFKEYSGNNWWCCSITKLCPTFCNPMDFSIPGFPALHYFLAVAAKSLQSYLTLWLHRRQPTRLPRPWSGLHFLLQWMKVRSESEVAQSCPTLSNPTDCSPPGSSIHGIFQARVLEWGAIAFVLFPGICSNSFPLIWDAIQTSHLLLSPSPLALNLSQHQCLSQ